MLLKNSNDIKNEYSAELNMELFQLRIAEIENFNDLEYLDLRPLDVCYLNKNNLKHCKENNKKKFFKQEFPYLVDNNVCDFIYELYNKPNFCRCKNCNMTKVKFNDFEVFKLKNPQINIINYAFILKIKTEINKFICSFYSFVNFNIFKEIKELKILNPKGLYNHEKYAKITEIKYLIKNYKDFYNKYSLILLNACIVQMYLLDIKHLLECQQYGDFLKKHLFLIYKKTVKKDKQDEDDCFLYDQSEYNKLIEYFYKQYNIVEKCVCKITTLFKTSNYMFNIIYCMIDKSKNNLSISKYADFIENFYAIKDDIIKNEYTNDVYISYLIEIYFDEISKLNFTELGIKSVSQLESLLQTSHFNCKQIDYLKKFAGRMLFDIEGFKVFFCECCYENINK